MQEPKLNGEYNKTFPWKLAVIFMVFSAAIIFAGIFYYKSQKVRIYIDEEKNLVAIALLKIGQIQLWHSERLGDANAIKNNVPLVRSIALFFKTNGVANKEQILNWMTSIRNEYDYSNVILSDTTLKTSITLESSDTIPNDTFSNDFSMVLRSHKIKMTDLHRSNNVKHVHMDILIPLLDSVKNKVAVFGVVILRVDPDKILFPLIQGWPTSSKSSETLILEKDGDSIIYLNELRHRRNSALKLKLPIENPTLLAVKALSGYEGVTEGVDYRNVPVVGYLARVPDFPWFMVAKVDKAEILAPLKRYVFLIILIVVLLILTTASVFGFWIWQQRVIFYRTQLKNEMETRKATEKLKESEDMFRKLFENMLNGFAYCKMIYEEGQPPDFLYLNVNESFSALTGLRDVVGKKASEAIPGIQKADPELLERYSRVAMTGKPEVFETWVEALKMWFAISVYSPQKEYFVAVFDVITARKVAENDLRASEERYRLLIDQASDGIFISDSSGNYTDVNARGCAMLGYSCEEILKMNLRDLIPLEDLTNIPVKWDELRTGKSVMNERRLIRKDGSLLQVEISARMFPDGRLQGITRDITERKLIEEKLRETNEYLSNLFNYANAPIITWDTSLLITRFNHAFENLSGYSEDEVIGKKIDILFPKKEIKSSLSLINEAVGGERWETVEIKIQRKDGDSRMVLWNSANIHDKDGKTVIATIAQGHDITKRKETELDLRDSEMKFRQTFDLSPIGIVMVWMDKKFLRCNDSFSQSLGFKMNELMGKTIADVTHPEDTSIGMDEMAAIARGEIETSHFQKRYLRKDGEIVWGDVLISLIRNNSEEPQYFLAIIQDITERKKTEEALLESEDKFKYIFDHSVIPKSITLPSGEINVNRAFCDMIGYLPDELKKINWADISHPDDIELTKNSINLILSGEKDSARFTKRYIHKSGSVIWAYIGTSLRRDEKGKPLYFLTTALDMTERKHAEESLRLKNFVFDDSIAANSISDINGVLTEVNAAFVRIWGYKSKNEIIGKSIASLIESDADANKILNALTQDGEWEGDYSALRKDGSTFIAHGLATVVKDEKGKGIGYQSAVLDVTMAKKAEELIHQLNEELEQKVIHRTELLEAANKELEAFSYSVSHDLRAPLRSVHGFTKILLEDYKSNLDEEGKRICGIISSSATQMGELIDDLLSFSRIGRTSMIPSALNMKTIVKTVFEEICPNNQKSRTNLKIGKLHKGFGDANLVKIVWTNLISNAIKYSSKKNISEISISSELKYNRVTYFIKDNGVGFDMKYKHKLFGVFQRLHSEAEFEGNGVGLAIVQRIILKHGGKVWADGEEGKGATFYFTLPVDTQHTTHD